jgi:hypothetical protein
MRRLYPGRALEANPGQFSQNIGSPGRFPQAFK